MEKVPRHRGEGEDTRMPATAKRVEEDIRKRTKAVELIVRHLRQLDKQFDDLESASPPIGEKDDLLTYTLFLVKKSFGNLAIAMAMGDGEEREVAMKELEQQYDGDYY